jgi:RNA polymerase sigma-70 factor, ECF subfamily
LSNDKPIVPRDLVVHTARCGLRIGESWIFAAEQIGIDRLGPRRGWSAVGEPSDGELLRFARDGDPAAFRILIRRHDRHLYRIARSVLLDDHEAEDAVQETYVLAFTRLVDFRGDASLSTWLTRIAINEALKRRRRRRIVDLDVIDAARDGADMQNYGSSMIAPEQDPERATPQRQLRRFLERAIDDLPERSVPSS